MLFDYLVSHYEKGEPIFLTDIHIDKVSDDTIRYYFKKLTDNKCICRFDSGIYYLPDTNSAGRPSTLSAETVVHHKYLYRKGIQIGFYSGYTLANRLGLSTQVPFKEEITSNNAPAPVREITIKNRTYILRRPITQITPDNAHVLQFLDCLKDIDKSAEEDMAVCGEILTQYAKKHRITKEQVDQYITFYPLKIYKAIYETGVKYVST